MKKTIEMEGEKMDDVMNYLPAARVVIAEEERVRREREDPKNRLDYFFDDVNRNTRKHVAYEAPVDAIGEPVPNMAVQQPKRYADGLMDGLSVAALVAVTLYLISFLM